MNEQELREMLQRRAGSVSAAPTDAPKALRRARRRLGVNAAVAVLLGLALFAGALTGVATLRAAPTPADLPTPAPTVPEQPPRELSGEFLEPGRYVLNTLAPNFDAAYRVSVEVPEGYRNIGGFAVLKKGRLETGVSAWVVEGVYTDGCGGADSRLDRVAGSTDALEDLLLAQEGFRVSTPADATVDGFAARYMERTLSPRVDPGRCVTDRFMVWRTRGNGQRWFAHAGQQELLWIVDVGGAPLVIDGMIDAAATAADRAEVVRMIESIQIDPR